MDTSRKYAVAVGVFFIIATAFLFIGEAVYGPYLNGADYLEVAYPNRMAVVAGVLLEFACVVAIPLTAVFLYPVLRKYSAALAIGYVGFRFFEAVFFLLTEVTKLSLISVSEGYLGSTGADAAFFRQLGGSMLASDQWVFSTYVLVFTLGSMILNAALFRTKLVPRGISAAGFAAAVLLTVGMVLVMLGLDRGPLANVWELIFAAPIAVQEMVLALWLIVKGFRTPAGAVEPGRATSRVAYG